MGITPLFHTPTLHYFSTSTIPHPYTMMYPHRLQPQLSTLRWVVSGTILLAIMTIAITEFHIETSVLCELRRRRLARTKVEFSVTDQPDGDFAEFEPATLDFYRGSARLILGKTYYLDEKIYENATVLTGFEPNTLEIRLSETSRIGMKFPSENGEQVMQRVKDELEAGIRRIKLEAATWKVYRSKDPLRGLSDLVEEGCRVVVDWGNLRLLPSGNECRFTGCSVAGEVIAIKNGSESEPQLYLQLVDSSADLEQLAKTLNELIR